LAGMKAAHNRGFIHRDIKPGNVLLDCHNRRALVTDFGVVKSTQTDTQITVTGTIMGTADYIAPEQARGLEVDHRTDLYAVGVLMYQMLSGRLPFDAKSATSMMFQHAYEPPPPLSEVAPDVPENLADVVMKLIAKKPEERYQSADEVLYELHNVRLRSRVTASSQTSIIEAPTFDTTAELPGNLASLTGKTCFGRLRNRIVDFFGTHAPQVIEYMKTTSQQVESVVAEYQRQRDKLVKLAQEAKAAVAEFESQAKVSRRAAQVADENAVAAKSASAKQEALKEKQKNEQAAAELAQLAAEQAEQSEEISLRLAALNAKLAQLRSQRDVLNARMNVAKARLQAEGIKPHSRFLRRTAVYAVLAFIISCFIVLLYYSIKPKPQIQPQWIDLIKLVDPARDAVAGKWTLSPAGLAGDQTPAARISFPYEPPQEYDFLIEFTPAKPTKACIAQLVSKGQIPFTWSMNAGRPNRCRIEDVDGHSVIGNTTIRPSYFFDVNRVHTSLVEVHNDKVRCFINGELIVEYKTDYNDLSRNEKWMIPNQLRLGIGTWKGEGDWKGPTIFRRVVVREITGKGKVCKTETLEEESNIGRLLAERAELERKKREARRRNDREAFKRARDELDQFLKEHPNLK
jgi:hypothetical protein